MDQFNFTMANFTLSPPGLQSQPSLDSKHLALLVVFSLFFSVGVPGNIAVIILKPNWEHLSSLSQSLVLNLAVSDLLSLLTIPLWIHTCLHGWTFGLMACKITSCVVYCSIYSNLLTVMGLSIQRYLVVVHQMGCRQVREKLLLVLLWLVACILSIRHVVVKELVLDEQWADCRSLYSSKGKQMAALMTEVLLGFGCFSVVAFLYIRIQIKINKAAFFNHPQTTRLVTSIILSFFILWLPYHTINVLSVAAISLKNEFLMKFCTSTRRIFAAVIFVQSCLNPFLYAFTSLKVCAVCLKSKPLQQNQSMPPNPDLILVA
ncbi:C-C chemokine receptor type 8-like [Nematolebias whitei]|uniref:C-C chemokine receptor type 8-like n=1 Tax=Nematolebias whitei TaxID=451745 RepID=UPI001899E79D|nr:C-C chemokine receptor type 8-like [Nematolebias whitei]